MVRLQMVPVFFFFEFSSDTWKFKRLPTSWSENRELSLESPCNLKICHNKANGPICWLFDLIWDIYEFSHYAGTWMIWIRRPLYFPIPSSTIPPSLEPCNLCNLVIYFEQGNLTSGPSWVIKMRGWTISAMFCSSTSTMSTRLSNKRWIFTKL